ncbi:2600_t:CDS:2, partial [Gigaspora rosea]
VIRMLQEELSNVDLISIDYLANPLANGCLELLESYCKVVGIDFLQPILEIETQTNEQLELESICKFLKPFEIATTILSKDLKISDHVLITYILDPRYKIEHLKATLLELGGYSESKAEQYINNVRQKILLYKTKYTCSISSNSEKKLKIIQYMMYFFLKGELQKNVVLILLDLYEREPLEKFENENNDIETNMAHDFLSMQPSSVASEKAFSRAGFTVTNDRANLNENTVSSIILMHSWLKESQKKSSPLEDLPEAK